MFKLIKSITYNKNKDDLVFIDCKHRINKKNLYIIKYFLNIGKILSRDFNIYLFNICNNEKSCKDIMDLYPEFNYVFIDINDVKFDILKENPNAHKDNKNKLINDFFIPELTFFNNIKGIFVCPSVLMTGDMDNEKFDSIKDNDIKAIEDLNKNIISIDNKKMWTYTAFLTKGTRIAIDLICYIIEKYNCKCYQFIIDPAQFYHYFNKKYNAITYNFEDDFRGTRDLHEFPMGQLVYIYNYDIFDLKSFKEKENNFIYGGNVLIFKGNRMQDWLTFFDDFYYEKSTLHVSNTNGIDNKRKPNKALLNHPLYNKTIESIKNNKLNKGYIENEFFEKELNNYKYSFILKCISKNDSLNFRIYYMLIYNILPLIDSRYDEDNLQIPKKFKDKLLVNNSKDLVDKINYFENHLDEANNLLEEMKSYFINNNYKNENFILNEFKNKYFKEIYMR